MKSKPNIILIIMDSVRASHLSCYGYHRGTTPNLDKLASEGILFEQAISEGCWTLPVHTTLFTGLFPISHGIEISRDALPDNFPTLAGKLKAQGYQTCCFSNNAYISQGTGLVQGFETVEDIWRLTSPRGIQRTKASKLTLRLKKIGAAGKPFIFALGLLSRLRRFMKSIKPKGDNGAKITNTKIKTWLSDSWDQSRPFFMFINYMECHEQYLPPYPYNRRFMPSRFSNWRIFQAGAHKNKIFSESEKIRTEDQAILQALYDGELNYLDGRIGELIELLRNIGILENSVFIVASDHGDSIGEHNLYGHRMALYEELVKVPLIIRYPALFKPGSRCTSQVQLGDLFLTLMEIGGSEPNQSNEFQSLCDLNNAHYRDFMIAENRAPKSLDSILMRMIRTDRYKMIKISNGNDELYDLKLDPDETSNLINERPDIASELSDKLTQWVSNQENRHQVVKKEADLDEMVVRQLKALNYM